MKTIIVILMLLFPTTVIADTNPVVNDLIAFVENEMNTPMVVVPLITNGSVQTTLKTIGTPVGIYSNNQIIVKYDLNGLKGQSILVHELVHHIQKQKNTKYACNRAKEYDAYRIQNNFLKIHGSNNTVSDTFIKKAASCENNA